VVGRFRQAALDVSEQHASAAVCVLTVQVPRGHVVRRRLPIVSLTAEANTQPSIRCADCSPAAGTIAALDFTARHVPGKTQWCASSKGEILRGRDVAASVRWRPGVAQLEPQR
jgi:hypothetical protein